MPIPWRRCGRSCGARRASAARGEGLEQRGRRQSMKGWTCVGIALVMLVLVGVADARRSRRSRGVSQVEEGLYFSGFTHQAIEGARLIDKGDSTLKVTIGASGQDGVRIRLSQGVTAFRLDATIANADSLPDGAWLEFGSRVAGSKDSVGFFRLARADTNGYSVTGAVAGASGQVVALYRSGTEVYREARPTSPVADFARSRDCLLCGFSTNDDVGRSKADGFVLLRTWWTESHEFNVVNRPGGAPDTTISADEIRILPAGGAA